MKKIILLGILSLLTIIPFSVKGQEIITVGWSEHPNYQETLENGDKYGYSYEYYRVIAKYTNYIYEFVDVSFDPDDSNYWQKYLDDGTIDVIGCISYSETLDNKYTFSALPQGHETNSIFTISSDTASTSNFTSKTIGVKAGHNSEALQNYLTENSISANIKEYDRFNEIIDALENKEIDLGSAYGTSGIANIRNIVYFGNTSFYYCFNNDNTDVINGFNKGMNEIQNRDISFNEKLKNKYIVPAKSSFVLTNEEIEYINEFNAASKKITIYFTKENYPYSYFEDGEHKGIMPDICKRVTVLTGLEFEANFERDSSQMIGFIENDFMSADDENYDLSQTLFSTNMVVIGDPSGKKIAVSRHITNHDRFSSYNYEFVVKEETGDCFDALANGEVDGVICTKYASNYYLGKSKYSDFSYYELPGIEFEVSMAIKREMDAEFTTIITKALNYISNAEIEGIIIDNTVASERNWFVRLIEGLEWYSILIMIIVFMIIVGILATLIINIGLKGKRLQKILDYDKLTGLYSYDGFCRNVPRIITKLDPKGKKYYITIGRINYYDVYLDINGPKMTDRLIVATGNELSNIIKGNEFLARFQDNSFAMLFIASDIDEIRERINESIVGERFDVVLRYGIYEINDDREDPRTMCDKALQVISEKGDSVHSFIEVYDKDSSLKKRDDMQLLSDFEYAIENKEFVVYYQPKYDAITEKIVSAEALVRWKKDNELIPPGRFIKLFEENDMIEKLDFYVFEQVCDALNIMKARKMKQIPIAVNFSRVHIYNPEYVNVLKEIAENKNVDTNLLEIELTETSFNIDLETINRVIEQLHNAGFTISIDDFGSGYSSLNMLKDVSVDILKIDMAFLSNFKAEAKSAIVVNSVIRMAKWLGMTTIVEGVDDIEQVEYLKSVGCDLLQGYYFAKPKPLEDLLIDISKGISISTTNNYRFDVNEVSQILGGSYFISKFFNSINIACGIYEYFEDRLELIRVNLAYERLLQANMFYDLNRINALDFVYKEDRGHVKEAFNLLAKTKVPRQVTFRRMIGSNNTKFLYVKGTAFLITGEEKRQLVCLTFTDITREKEYHAKYEEADRIKEELTQLLDLLVQKHYEYVALVDVDTSEYELYGNKENMIKAIKKGLFNDGTIDSAYKFVKEEMREKYFENAKFETVMKHMTENEEYSYRFEINKNGKTYERRVDFHYYGRDKKKILLLSTLIDIDKT